MTSSSSILVTNIAPKKAAPPDSEANSNSNSNSNSKPEHWDDPECSGFHNPWPSFRPHGAMDALHLLSILPTFPRVSQEAKSLIPIRNPTWGAVEFESKEENAKVKNKDKITTTWLGHACFLVELPSRSESDTDSGGRGRGVRVLFDPVFSDRCSPSQWIGPKRYTPPPCEIEDIPEVDAVVISHNHYDHLDTHTIKILSQRPRTPHFFAPLGNAYFFRSLGVPDSHVHLMDWWDSKRVEVSSPSSSSSKQDKAPRKVTVEITCTPAQHFTGRSLFDRFKTLWASWVVEEVRPPPPTHAANAPAPADANANAQGGVKVFFGGDTGYRAVLNGQDEDKVPTCPVFKEIGARFGGFEFAMIPIGAYKPRQYMSPIHCAPQDSVRIFKDIKAKKALGMHWATWVLTTEDVLEPPKRLAEECRKIGIEDGAFGVCDIGETMFF